MCFHDGIRAALGGERSRRGTGGIYCSAACARGRLRQAPLPCTRFGSERSHRRRRAGAGARVVLAVADAGSLLRRHAASSLVAEAGCNDSTPAPAPARRHGHRLRRASVHPAWKAGRASLPIRTAAISAAQDRSNAQERPRGGRYFICRPPPDGRRSTVHPWRPTRPPRRAVQVSTSRFPSWRRVPSSLVEGSVVNCLHRIHAVDAGGARSSMDRCSGLWAAGVRCRPRV